MVFEKFEVEESPLTDRHKGWFVEIAGTVLDAITRDASHPIPGWTRPRCEYRKTCLSAA